MEQEQKLNKQIKFGEENKKMKNLTNQDFKDIENEVKRDLIFKDKKHIKKMTKLLQKRRNKDISIIKKMYPYLNDNEILEITNDYQEYKNIVQATETFTDFPINYEDSNISKFLTKDDIAELKIAIEEMAIFVESLED
ncbi:pathogenicity island protein [Staphylococcus haemolyticus]|uniref:pathogenicity island protein n=1 Tax=Staphylococcus haemolyticus TaxID=1283 RepID=UPI001879B2E8|nr:pathogenicity island protein [Staphylococcus haemolyticus]MBE7354483.1 pathogenicity island protein [Staphylococcus haemolyticus]MCH4401613.1 pathogenicity island protein [Staphylococcus haemolyticus]MCH4429708.1 pathogenicity island protein [Staphylococcus haemolyticus]MCH4516566.1 pathogenicity island protein [Staphylococcus haemolyticus]MDO0987157.1 pathogenicity island protein [Staphylococcus haemolyticus]